MKFLPLIVLPFLVSPVFAQVNLGKPVYVSADGNNRHFVVTEPVGRPAGAISGSGTKEDPWITPVPVKQ